MKNLTLVFLGPIKRFEGKKTVEWGNKKMSLAWRKLNWQFCWRVIMGWPYAQGHLSAHIIILKLFQVTPKKLVLFVVDVCVWYHIFRLCVICCRCVCGIIYSVSDQLSPSALFLSRTFLTMRCLYLLVSERSYFLPRTLFPPELFLVIFFSSDSVLSPHTGHLPYTTLSFAAPLISVCLCLSSNHLYKLDYTGLGVRWHVCLSIPSESELCEKRKRSVITKT